MTAIRLKHISRFRDRHGHWRHYLRLPGHKPTALPGMPGSPEFMAAYFAALQAAEPAKPRAPSVVAGSLDDLAMRFYDSPRWRGLRASTQATYRRMIDELRGDHGSKPIRLLTREGIERLLSSKSEHPAAYNQLLRLLRQLIELARDLRWISTDPTQEVRRVKRRTDGIHAWSEAEIAQYEQHWPSGSRPRLALALLLYTGQRRSDVVRMGRQHLREGGRMLQVRQVKTEAELVIPLHTALLAEIAHVPDGQMLFLATERGAGFTANGFYMRFREWCSAAGLPANCSPHGLRKACGRRLAEAGCTAHQIMSILGHRTLAEAQRYTRGADQRRLALAAMGLIENGTSNPNGEELPTLIKNG